MLIRQFNDFPSYWSIWISAIWILQFGGPDYKPKRIVSGSFDTKLTMKTRSLWQYCQATGILWRLGAVGSSGVRELIVPSSCNFKQFMLNEITRVSSLCEFFQPAKNSNEMTFSLTRSRETAKRKANGGQMEPSRILMPESYERPVPDSFQRFDLFPCDR